MSFWQQFLASLLLKPADTTALTQAVAGLTVATNDLQALQPEGSHTDERPH